MGSATDLLFNGKNLLIVEDDEVLREILVEEFEFGGAKVFSASNGEEAFRFVENCRIDGIISDVRMPGVDGVEFLRKLRSSGPAAPGLIFLTGYADITPAEAYDLGAEGMIGKPFDFEVLSEKVMRLITPKIIRWKSLANIKPKGPVIKRHFASLQKAIEEGDFMIGRGGVFLNADTGPGHLVLPNNDFCQIEISFDKGPLSHLEGIVSIRWVQEFPKFSTSRWAYGLEFEFLSTDAADEISFLIDELRLRPYIPRGPIGRSSPHLPQVIAR